MLDYNRNQAQAKLKSYDYSAKIGKLWHLKEGYKSQQGLACLSTCRI